MNEAEAEKRLVRLAERIAYKFEEMRERLYKDEKDALAMVYEEIYYLRAQEDEMLNQMQKEAI